MMRLMSRILMAAVVLAGTAGLSQATFTVTITNNGVPVPPGVLIPPGSPSTPGGENLTNFTVVLQPGATLTFGADGIQNGATSASLQSNFRINNNDPTSTAITNLVITVTESGFTLPAGGAAVRFIPTASAIAGSSTGTVLSENLNGGAFAPASFTFNAATPLVPANSPSSTNVVAAAPGAFTLASITQTFTFGSISVGAQITGSIQSSVTAQVVPVPATALAAVAGLPLLGLGARLRRRVVA